MEKYLPIIYVRGYAGSQGAVESTVDRPYYGFNLGSTQVRTGPDGDPDFFIFESPLVRLIKDHGYTDLFARIDHHGAVELLNGEDGTYETGRFPARSLWIFRYYDRTSERAGDGTRDVIETLGENLGRLVRARWAGLDSDLPAAGKRYPRNDNIRFPLPSKNLAQGDLVLRVRDERGDST
jgi:hypothetical protein